MIIPHQSRIILAGAASAAFFLSGPGAQAQSTEAGSIQAPVAMAWPRATSPRPVPPKGPYSSTMPLASPEQFANAERRAPFSVPTGTPGATSNGSSAVAEKEPLAYGTSTAPYTTARVAVGVLGDSSTVANTPVTSYPYRAAGKLYFKIGKSNKICSAALIKKGVLLTAAHCVFAFGKGASGWYTNFVWCPANTSSTGGVYGCYNAGPPRILTTYFDGTDVCTEAGIVCNDDIATLLVPPVAGVYVGNVVGWYNYSWNGYSYKASTFLGNVTTVQVTQLGYPGAFDSGYQMIRTDAVGWYFTSGNLKNTQIGSAQTGGSSGGPWLANFGTRPSVGFGASLGSDTTQTIVGVTSYGSTTVGFNRQGSSFLGQNSQYPGTYGGYGSGNIGLLVRDTCTANSSYC